MELLCPKAADLKAGIECLSYEFSDLALACGRRINYFCQELESEESIRYQELESKYNEAEEVCSLFTEDDISLECLCYELQKLDLLDHLRPLQEYFPEALRSKFLPPLAANNDELDGSAC